MSDLTFLTPGAAFTAFTIKMRYDLDAATLEMELARHARITADMPPGAGVSGAGHIFQPATANHVTTPIPTVLTYQHVVCDKSPPESLVKAEVAAEISANLAATGRTHLSRVERREITESVTERLTAEAQRSFKATRAYIDTANRLLLIGSASESAIDPVLLDLAYVVSFAPFFGADVRDWPAASYHAEADSHLFAFTDWVIPEFMMWLWYNGAAGKIACTVDPARPVSFAATDDGNRGEVRVSGSERNLQTPEAGQAVRSGKLLVDATYLLDLNGSDSFSIQMKKSGGVKIAVVCDNSPLDRDSRFEFYYDKTIAALEVMKSLFSEFVQARNSKTFSADMHEMSAHAVRLRG